MIYLLVRDDAVPTDQVTSRDAKPQSLWIVNRCGLTYSFSTISIPAAKLELYACGDYALFCLLLPTLLVIINMLPVSFQACFYTSALSPYSFRQDADCMIMQTDHLSSLKHPSMLPLLDEIARKAACTLEVIGFCFFSFFISSPLLKKEGILDSTWCSSVIPCPVTDSSLSFQPPGFLRLASCFFVDRYACLAVTSAGITCTSRFICTDSRWHNNIGLPASHLCLLCSSQLHTWG